MKNTTLEKIKTLFSGFAAGCFIGFGGICFILCKSFLPPEYSALIGALLFPVGLIMVCVTGTKLYTGRIGYCIDRNGVKPLDKAIDLCIMLVGNLIGAAAIGFIFYILSQNNPTITSTLIGVINGKNDKDFITLFYSSILCGVMVFLAVDFFKLMKSEVAKIIMLMIPIFIFVFAGFDHCIANAFYYAAGLMAKRNVMEAKDIAMLFANILGVAVGNSLGSLIVNSIKKVIYLIPRNPNNLN